MTNSHYFDSVSVTEAFKKGKFFNIAVVFDTEQTKKEYDTVYNPFQ